MTDDIKKKVTGAAKAAQDAKTAREATQGDVKPPVMSPAVQAAPAVTEGESGSILKGSILRGGLFDE